MLWFGLTNKVNTLEKRLDDTALLLKGVVEWLQTQQYLNEEQHRLNLKLAKDTHVTPN